MHSLKNRVQLIGRLGKDPEVKYLTSGRAWGVFSLATNESYRDKQGERVTETQWHNVVVWGKNAEFAEKYLNKGKEIAVEGKLVHRSYEASDGAKRYVTEVVVHNIVLMGSKPKEEEIVYS